MKPGEQNKPQDGQKATSEYDVDKKRADDKSGTRQDVGHDEIDSKTGEYAPKKSQPH